MDIYYHFSLEDYKNMKENEKLKHLLECFNDLFKLNHEISIETLKEIDESSLSSLNLMTCHFFKRLVHQNQSFQVLEYSNDSLLIARSMFEGYIYLIYTYKKAENKADTTARRWELMNHVKKISAEQEKQKNEYYKSLPEELRKEIDDLFKKKNGKYSYKWEAEKDKHISIKQMCESLSDVTKAMHNTHYVPTSSYHHWSSDKMIYENKNALMLDYIVMKINAYTLAITVNINIARAYVRKLEVQDWELYKCKLDEIELKFKQSSLIRMAHVTPR